MTAAAWGRFNDDVCPTALLPAGSPELQVGHGIVIGSRGKLKQVGCRERPTHRILRLEQWMQLLNLAIASQLILVLVRVYWR